ncbi:hypothetical protein [Myroides injenensis]|uniref:hypothetical protein n=1 Tax=Myroides injenensis TaxID=1183151 RepID=UPI0002892DBB|nr:hypothetical protein [Myroides injenensis]
MKKLILSAAVAFTVLATSNIYAQQGFGTNTPDRSSAVDIVSSKRGLLIPRIDLTKTTEAGPVAKPENALFVYNKATANDVTPGFYYWEAANVANAKEQGLGRWVRFVSSNSGNAVTVSPGTNVIIDKTITGHDTDYKVSVKGGTAPNQVLVTKLGDNNTYVSEWVNPEEFLKDVVTGVNGVTTEVVTDDKGKTKTTVGLGGALGKATTITTDATHTLAIEGLTKVEKKDLTGNNIVIADGNGVLKETSAKNLIEDAIEKGTDDTNSLKAKTLKGEGITVTATGATTITYNVANSLLKDVTLGIADGAVKNSKIEAGAVTADKMTAKDSDTEANAPEGTVPVAGKDGKVTYQKISTAIGQDLTTDGKIVIGDNKASKLENSVLVATNLSIKEGSIGTTELTNGAVTAEKLDAGKTTETTPRVGVADNSGNVIYKELSGANLNGKALKSTSIVVTGGAKALLDETSIEIKGGEEVGQIFVTKKEGDKFVTEWVDASTLGNTVTASNGLTKDGNDIQLGGKIDKGTTLAIAPGTSNPDGTVTGGGSLAITGLNTADPKKGNKTVVVQANGQLATIDTAAGNVTINQGGDVNISDNSVVNNYHPSMSEIVIEVTLKDTDTNLNLPAVNGTEGQTISVKIVNTDESHKGYLNIKSGTNVLAYGAMPFQGWIIKSNGSKWIVVGRN